MKQAAVIWYINKFGIEIDRDTYRKFKDAYNEYFGSKQSSNKIILHYFWCARCMFDKFELIDEEFYFSIGDVKVNAFKDTPDEWIDFDLVPTIIG